MDFLKDLFGFLRDRKKYWLIPMILIFLLLGILIVIRRRSSYCTIHLYIILKCSEKLIPIKLFLLLLPDFFLLVFCFPQYEKYFFVAALVVGILGLLIHVTRIVDHLDLGKI